MEVHGIDWIAVFAYFDETGMNRRDPTNAVSGYLFDKAGAKRFREKYWRDIHSLIPPNKHGEKIYHTGKCVRGYDEFETLEQPQREHIVDLMVDAICESCKLGVTIVLPEDVRKEALSHWPNVELMAGRAYSQCLLRCMEYMMGAIIAEGWIGRIEYVFEAGSPYQQQTEELMAKIRRTKQFRERYRLHDYSFRDKGPDIPHLYAPDLLAWETQRAEINANNPQREEWRLTLQKLVGCVPHITRYMNVGSVLALGINNLNWGLTAESYLRELRHRREEEEKKKRWKEFRERRKNNEAK